MSVAESIDLAVWPLFHQMSRRGIRLDAGRMEALLADVRAQMASVSVPFNPASGDEVAAWMDAQGMTGKRTKKKRRLSTDERSLSAYGSPMLAEVVRFRGLQKLETTFIRPTLDAASKTGGVIHPRWRLTKVKSGRVACEDPNLLAFPSRDEMGRRVRDCFVPREGMLFISVDFSQIEPRMVAALSRDEHLLHIYEAGLDVYADAKDRLSITRQEAKVVTLGVLYGMTDRRLYEQLVLAANGGGSKWDLDACGLLILRWFAAYPGVKTLVAKTLTAARANGGWAYTHFGRGRYLPALFLEGQRWPAAKLREEAERQGFNHLIQGSSQEEVKLSQMRVAKRVPEVYPLLQIHDELVAEAEEGRAEELAQRMAEAMSTTFMGVTLKTEYKVGHSWGALKG